MSTRRRIAVTIASVALAVGGGLVAAPAAAADQIWYQGVDRSAADAPCPTGTAEEVAAGWTAWGPSWAQWANHGQGGYVCARSITWAYESSGSEWPGCQAFVPDSVYYDFHNAVGIPSGTPGYLDPHCTVLGVDLLLNAKVYTTGGSERARELCRENGYPYDGASNFGTPVYGCVFIP